MQPSATPFNTPAILERLFQAVQHTSDERTFLISLFDLLARRPRTNEYVFTDEQGNVLRQDPCRVKILAFAQKAGIRRIGWHTLRHTFASHLANNGVTIQAIQVLLGHSDLKTTMRYAHIASETLISAINVLQTCSAKIWSQNGHTQQKEAVLSNSI